MSEEKKGIKECLEMLDGLELLSVKGLEIAKDGLELNDIPKALEVFKQYEVLVAAVKGSGEILAEVKDIDQAELMELGARVLGMVKKIKEAV